MQSSLQRVYSGADGVKAADVVRQLAERREHWPYVHIYAPPNSEPVHQIGFVETPIAGVTVEVLLYTVPSGFRFFLQSILQTYTGGNFVPGAALWTVNRNTPPGVVNIQGQPEQGLTALPIPLGSWVSGNQWPLPRAYEFEENDEVRSMATNVSLSEGDPNYFVSGFFGYLVPEG